MNDLEVVLAYHRRTKHHPMRYARSLGFLDWESQPDPFLKFEGAPLRHLDRGPFPADATFGALDRPTGRAAAPIDARTVADLLYHSVALSAWKEVEGSRWSLRCNPSSGNLHPTETYVMTDCFGDGAAVHHYRPDQHALEERRRLDDALWSRLAEETPSGLLLIGLTTIPWREAWKYGERAYRYCQHDVGHAIAAVAYAASTLRWGVRALLDATDEAVARLLRTERSTGPEAEHVDVLMVVGPEGDDASRSSPRLDVAGLAGLLRGEDHGIAAPLSPEHHEWPVIGEVAEAAAKTTGAPAGASDDASKAPSAPDAVPPPPLTIDARALIRQRRSAVDMDGRTGLARDAFLRMVARLRPSRSITPWTAFPWPASVHPFFFVHRVDGLPPGLYVLVRDPAALSSLRAACDARFTWTAVNDAPPDFFRLDEKDHRSTAQSASCHQAIAADGAFAVAMVAGFEPRLAAEGAWFYRAMHWEAGALGQVLYLEAEAAGVRATGIGCFFDDLTHQALGLRDLTFQTLYHFTVGGAVDDPRLATRPAYPENPESSA